MALRVNWHDPAVIQLMEEYPTDERDTEEKLAKRIFEMTGVSVDRSTINRRLWQMRRAQDLANPQVRREEEFEDVIDSCHNSKDPSVKKHFNPTGWLVCVVC